MNAESNKLTAITTTESIAHRDKDMTRFQAEMADERQRVGGLWPGMGEDEDIEFVDMDDVEEMDDFEYEEVNE